MPHPGAPGSWSGATFPRSLSGPCSPLSTTSNPIARSTSDLLFDFLRIPSVSAQSEYHREARKAGDFVRDQLTAAGYEATLFEGDGLPTVFGTRVEDPMRRP